MFLKRKWKKIYLLPCIQPHKLDSVNKCKTNEKTNEKKLCKEKSDSSVRLKNRDDISLKTLFYGTSLNIILGFWLITLTVQLYFFIATLKIWVSYNLEWLHTLCILIHLLMQPRGCGEWPRQILFLLKISIQYQAAPFSRPRSQFFTIRTET